MSKQTTNTETLITMRSVMLEAVEVQTAIEEGKSGKGAISQHLMICARKFVDGKTKALDVDMFLTACKQEEKFIKSQEAGINRQDRVPPCWTQAKSNIKAAADFGLSPADFKTESAMRKALNECRKAAKQEALEQEAGEVEGNKLTLKAVDNDIRGVMAGLADLYGDLDDDKALLLKQDLVALHAKYKQEFKKIMQANVRKDNAKDKNGKRPDAGQITEGVELVSNG